MAKALGSQQCVPQAMVVQREVSNSGSINEGDENDKEGFTTIPEKNGSKNDITPLSLSLTIEEEQMRHAKVMIHQLENEDSMNNMEQMVEKNKKGNESCARKKSIPDGMPT